MTYTMTRIEIMPGRFLTAEVKKTGNRYYYWSARTGRFLPVAKGKLRETVAS